MVGKTRIWRRKTRHVKKTKRENIRKRKTRVDGDAEQCSFPASVIFFSFFFCFFFFCCCFGLNIDFANVPEERERDWCMVVSLKLWGQFMSLVCLLSSSCIPSPTAPHTPFLLRIFPPSLFYPLSSSPSLPPWFVSIHSRCEVIST